MIRRFTPTRVSMRSLATAIAFAALGACQRVPAAETPDATTAGPTAVSTPAAPSDAPAPAIVLALDGSGVTLVNGATGATRAIAFGTPAVDAIGRLTALLGPHVGRATNSECGAGPLELVTFSGGLQLALQRDRFMGWTARAATPTLTTMSGVGLGSTRAELTAAYVARISQTSLGTEFMAGGLQGVLASTADSARITDLWAGTACVAR